MKENSFKPWKLRLRGCIFKVLIVFAFAISLLGMVVGSLLCKFNIQFCVNPLEQARMVLAYSYDGYPDPFENYIPSSELQCPESSVNLTRSLELAYDKAILNHRLKVGTKNSHYRTGRLPDIVFFLGSQKSGTTWGQQVINSQGAIIMGGERLLSYSRSCVLKSCTWNSFRLKLEAEINSLLVDHYYVGGIRAIGFRIMYDHIPGAFRGNFADWLYCHNARVFHFVRRNVISSFWTLQARLVDTLGMGEYIDDSTDKNTATTLASNRIPIVLQVQPTKDYVIRIEEVRKGFRELFTNFYYGEIPYLEMAYEDLASSKYGSLYWNAVFEFMGVRYDHEMNINGMKTQKLHPLPCKSKIANWDEIRNALADTESIQACEAENSRHHAILLVANKT